MKEISSITNMKKNFTLDTILLIMALICIITGILLDFHLIPGGKEARYPFKLAHIYSGYVMAIGLIFHIVWHKDWIKSVSKKFFSKGK